MIKVSVFITTYNHEPYIAQCIESALNQTTNFEYEILIGEDCSTDETRSIVKHYAGKHPDKIKALYYDHNIGGHKNVDNLIQAAKGKYLAWLEGDDYWTDPFKLQKQADILDANKNVMISTHNTMIINEKNETVSHMFTKKHPHIISTIDTLIMGNYIQTPSCVFRHRVTDVNQKWIHTLGLGDWPRHLLLAEHGTIHYMADVMAAYRQTSTGVWHSKTELYKTNQVMQMLTLFNEHTHYKYDQIVTRSILFHHSYLLRHEKKQHKNLLKRVRYITKKAIEEIKIASKIKLSTLLTNRVSVYVIKGWSFF